MSAAHKRGAGRGEITMTKIYAARYSLNGNENLRSFSVNDVQEIYEHYNRLNEECGYDTASGEGYKVIEILRGLSGDPCCRAIDLGAFMVDKKVDDLCWDCQAKWEKMQ